MQIISITNHKGGVAKTTTAVNLSAALVERGRRVLLVDLDPQASASLWLGVRSKGTDLLDSLNGKKRLGSLVQTTRSGIDLVPCGVQFSNFERECANEPGAESLLRTSLDSLPDTWDYVFLDCPPSLGMISINAMVGTDRVLVPVAAQVLSLEPLARLMNTMWEVREKFRPELKLSGLFATRVDQRSSHGSEVLQLLRQQFAENVYNVSISENVKLAEAAGFQKTIMEYAPASKGAQDYRLLCEEFEERLVKDLAKETI